MGKKLDKKVKGVLTEKEIQEMNNLLKKEYPPDEMTIRSPNGVFGGSHSMPLDVQETYGSLFGNY